jgi:hypothetical protein
MLPTCQDGDNKGNQGDLDQHSLSGIACHASFVFVPCGVYALTSAATLRAVGFSVTAKMEKSQ